MTADRQLSAFGRFCRSRPMTVASPCSSPRTILSQPAGAAIHETAIPLTLLPSADPPSILSLEDGHLPVRVERVASEQQDPLMARWEGGGGGSGRWAEGGGGDAVPAEPTGIMNDRLPANFVSWDGRRQ